MAQGSAITAWQRAVQRKYGNEYVVWNRAACGKLHASPAGIGLVGSNLTRVTAAGFPCSQNPGPDAKGVPTYETTAKGEPLTRNQIEELQNLLMKAGYKLKSDGQFGGETRKALQNWQRNKGQPPIKDREEPDLAVLESLRRA